MEKETGAQQGAPLFFSLHGSTPETGHRGHQAFGTWLGERASVDDLGSEGEVIEVIEVIVGHTASQQPACPTLTPIKPHALRQF